MVRFRRSRVVSVEPPVPATACWAPRAALYLQPDGWVNACCGNDGYVLGRVGDRPGSTTLRELWDGSRRAAQVVALDHGDLSLGCGGCAAVEEPFQLARMFDRYAGTAAPEFPRYIDFALSNTCNLQCVMCNGDLSSSIRSRREHRAPLPAAYGDAFFAELAEFLPHLEATGFKGGEPFLCRPTRRTWDLMVAQGSTADVHVTTNGTVLNPAVEELLAALRMDLTISIDGASASTVEAIRVGTDHRALMANVDRFQDLVAGYGGTIVLNFCLVVANWHELGPFLAEADRRDLTARVVVVTKPAEHDLGHLPPDQLADVVAGLRAQDERWRGELGRNRSVWVAEVERLIALADARARETAAPAPVSIRPSAAGPGTAAAAPAGPDADELARGLTAWAGQDPITVDIVDGLIAEVQVPGWAAAQLGPLDWVGLGGAEILDSLAGRVPGALDLQLEEEAEGVMAGTLTFGTGAGATVFRALVFRADLHADRRRERVLLATPTST